MLYLMAQALYLIKAYKEILQVLDCCFFVDVFPVLNFIHLQSAKCKSSINHFTIAFGSLLPSPLNTI